MKRIETMEEIQAIEYDILVKSTEFFEAHQIQYILAGGSMLGAVRHNGFIPWDDDIDLLMPRDSFEILRMLAEKERYIAPHIHVLLPGDDLYPHPFIKICDDRTKLINEDYGEKFPSEVWIDVFPLDHFPREKWKHQLYMKYNRMLRAALAAGTLNRGLNHKYLQIPMEILSKMLGGYKKITVMMDKAAARMDKHNQNSGWRGDGPWPEGLKDCFKEEWLFPVIKHKFEEGEFNIPENYDGYLTHFYGDYMTPPPENKRVRHTFEAYRLDED